MTTESSDLTLLIDNYDSFTYNVYQYLCELGANVRVFRNDEITVEQCRALNPVNIVISPGPGTPSEAGVSQAVIKAFEGVIPILGICLGHQSIIEVYGGVVERAQYIMHGKVSPVIHDGKGVFTSIPSPFLATRYHSLCGRLSTLPDVLISTAHVIEKAQPRDKDDHDRVHEENHGEPVKTCMGVRHKVFKIEGVQFHPESITTEHGKTMLANFLKLRGGKWE